MEDKNFTFKEVSNLSEIAGFLLLNQEFERFFFKRRNDTLVQIHSYELFVEAVAYKLPIYEQRVL